MSLCINQPGQHHKLIIYVYMVPIEQIDTPRNDLGRSFLIKISLKVLNLSKLKTGG